jgi:CxxC-x17-CxxC domain-containing protein
MQRQNNNNNKGFRGNNSFNKRSFSGPREMHKAICSECKQECEVPFKPKDDRPVYCKECYMKKK